MFYKLILAPNLQSEVPDFKINRQSNISPARNRRSTSDNKKDAVSKAAFKRNLFGDHEETQSQGLAKHLIDSPAQSCSFLIDPAIQSVKYNDFNHKAQSWEEVKGKLVKDNLSFIYSLRFRA